MVMWLRVRELGDQVTVTGVQVKGHGDGAGSLVQVEDNGSGGKSYCDTKQHH